MIPELMLRLLRDGKTMANLSLDELIELSTLAYESKRMPVGISNVIFDELRRRLERGPPTQDARPAA